jgi:hypothetical protein
MKTILLVILGAVLWGWNVGAVPLDTGTFTEIIQQVDTLAAADSAATPARVNEIVKAPERVRTGPSSRAEITAPDQTIIRVGANTVFSFAGGSRTVNLDQGSLLFHAPKGIGGGIIKSGGAAAAVLGTTLIVVATTNGGFKVIFLEGKGTATLPNGRSVKLKAGQLVYVLPGQTQFSPVFNIDLGRLTASSLLIQGFDHELSSAPLIAQAVQQQQSEIGSAGLSDTGATFDNTGFVPGGPGTSQDPNTVQIGTVTQNPPPAPGGLYPVKPPAPPHPPAP